jgi:hypothetical protein
MARQELLYRGRLDVGDGNPRHLEVWKVEEAAVVFEGGTIVARALAVEVGWTDDDRLLITGSDPDDGTPVSWEGPDPIANQGTWGNQRVRWHDGTVWASAWVTWSQYGVHVGRVSEPVRKLAGARTVVEGAQRFIIDGNLRHMIENTSSGCGCGK